MRRTTKTLLGAAAVACLIVGGGVSGPSTAQVSAGVPTTMALVQLDTAVGGLVDGMQEAFGDAYLGEGLPDEQDVAEVLADSADTEGDGVAAFVDYAESIVEEALAVLDPESPEQAISVDAVTVEEVGVSETTMVDDSTIATVIDVEITRHIEGENIDWVEVVPHEVHVDVHSGAVTSVVVHDLEYQLEQAKALRRKTTAKYTSDLGVGDLLQYKNKSSSEMNHSMVVTYKSGSTPYSSYHTTNTKNKPFMAISGLNVYWLGHLV